MVKYTIGEIKAIEKTVEFAKYDGQVSECMDKQIEEFIKERF